jgi:hypothetical protein
MSEEVWTEYEYNAVLKALQKALDDGTIPPEDRAAVFRGKQKIEKVTVRRAPPKKKKAADYSPRWE